MLNDAGLSGMWANACSQDDMPRGTTEIRGGRAFKESACGCESLPSGVLLLCFLERPVCRAAPILYDCLAPARWVSGNAGTGATHLSTDVAIKLAISEYLHVDSRFMQATQ